MKPRVKKAWEWGTSETALLIALGVLPLLVSGDLTKQISVLLIYSILALGLHVVVGYTGLLHLGIAASFGIGAYTAGILATNTYPFQLGFLPSLVLSFVAAAAASMALAAPTLRLRGDYLALVTLGFGEVLKFSLRNLESITNGTRAISPIPPVVNDDWPGVDRKMYFIAFAVLAITVVLLKNLERSRLGRAWVALREDELAATCMGIDIAAARLWAFGIGSALAGIAGCLYAFHLGGTAQPDAYDFNRSIITLCCLILGGLGSIRGALLGVFLLIGFDNIVSSQIDALIQSAGVENPLLKFSSWRLMIFGLALILMMRFRPEGLLPAGRVQLEMHEHDEAALKGVA
jgi:branched-chain amino acid transport system permease protein